MLSQVDFTEKDLPKSEYKPARDELIARLVSLQQEARVKGVGLVVLFEGWFGAGKGSRISDLMFHLDARSTSVYVTPDLDVPAMRDFVGFDAGVSGYYPLMQQFWQALGDRSSITFYDRGWYSSAVQQVLFSAFGDLALPRGVKRKKLSLEAIADSKDKDIARARGVAQRCVASISDFEQQLADDGYEVVKFFVHVSQEGQRRRLEKLKADPTTAWRVSDQRFMRMGNYKSAYGVYDLILESSDFDFAPWVVLNGEHPRQSNLRIARELIAVLEEAIARKDAQRRADEQAMVSVAAPPAPVGPKAPDASRFPIEKKSPSLAGIDYTLSLPQEAYRKELRHLQKKLFRLENKMYQARIPLMLMYEGWDAAGKGGNIKRVAQALDARAYQIFPSPAPTKPELAHPHLWRYWTRLPKAGHVGIYDRSWYGRVLVERVEGFATPERWAQAYDEINAFERDLIDWGAILLKFWVEVSPDEQLRRFGERQNDPAKRWKITEDDWRNREKYPAYREAVEDMFRLTSTKLAPWTVLESDDKRYARVKALRVIVDALKERLD